jgi:coniferyl-aldehyde dehydrogenase
VNAIVARMDAVLAAQRAAFAQHPSPPLAERKVKLKALKRALRAWQGRIIEAVNADFGTRAPTETRLLELLGPTLAASHALRKLRRWMRPQRRATELLFVTNSAWVEYQPKGVVGIIVPWNMPGYLSLGPLVAALAAGNRAMIKMSELSPNMTAVLAQMLATIYPEDEVAVFGGETEEARAFSRLPFDHLIFTGSPEVGRHVMQAAAENLVPVTLELGGKSPALVGAEADLADAARRIAHGKAFSAGQVCVAPDYALVPRTQVDAFAAAVAAEFVRMYPDVQGHPDYTSIISERHAVRLRDLVADAEAKGARILPAGAHGTGRQLPLVMVLDVHDQMNLASEEIFGPVLPVVAYDTLEEAIAYVNARPRPLALYTFGLDRPALERVRRATHSGGMAMNDWGWHAFQHDLPFGGIGNSGMGSYHGEEGFHALSHARAVFRRHRFFPTQVLYPPYGGWLQRLALRFFLGEIRDR